MPPHLQVAVTGRIGIDADQAAVFEPADMLCQRTAGKIQSGSEIIHAHPSVFYKKLKDISACFKKSKGGIFMAKDVRVGSGPIWGDEDCRNILVDDLRVYSGVLTAAEIGELAR